MKFLKILQQNSYFFVFIFLFGYLQSIQGRILVRQSVNVYTFTPEAAISTFIENCFLFFIVTYFLRRFQKNTELNFLSVIKVFVLSLLLYLLVSNIALALIALAFNTWERNFTYNVILSNNIGDALDVCIYGAFFIAYFFYQKSKQDAQRLLGYNKALADSKIAQLKSQLNPHFLFNNLNALDQLIIEDRNKASVYLNDFAELYRYVLEVSDKQLVSIEEELAFTESYFRIMQYKFGEEYSLEVLAPSEINGFVPPLALQLLVENAIEHNIATADRPIKIQIEVTDHLVITNNVVEKRSNKIGGGRALQNLSDQYMLLSNKSVRIIKTETAFTVNLPIVKYNN